MNLFAAKILNNSVTLHVEVWKKFMFLHYVPP